MTTWAMRDNGEDDDYVPPYTATKTDDFSCDPSKWSWSKLCHEVKHGMPAVIAEYESRIKEVDTNYLHQKSW